MAQESKPAELALIKAARTLDQGDVATIPDKLDQILKILEVYPGGNFHAAEEVIVRWLLKNMNGSSDDAERLRRYPPTWRILTILFSSIPIFSLAKSLADRRFVGILQAAVKDLSEAKKHGSSRDGESSDTEMADAYPDETQPRPSKRKRLDPVSFDLETQRQIPACLRAAEGLFASLHALLARLEPKYDGRSQDDPMGAEHIKSLFSSHANKLKDILAPALAICELAMNDAESNSYAEQDTWISTISSILDLHIKNEGDAVEVATHLSRTSLIMLGRLTGTLHDWQLAIPSEVQTKWARDLRRLLTRNLILPARAAFVNRRTTEAIEMAVQMATSSDTLCYPVIFDLVLASPRIAGSQSAERQNEVWSHAVFGIVEAALRSSNSGEKPASLLAMMDMVHKRGAALSLHSLRSVCGAYALHPDCTNWTLLLRIAEINCDAFITDESQELLHEVLERTREEDSLSDEEFKAASSFIITLAAGSARVRNLTGFIMIWFKYLALTGPHLEPKTNRYQLWYNKQLNSTATQSLQKSMNTKQVASLLDWLDSHDGVAEKATLILILAAISEEITQDEFIDAVGNRLFDMVFSSDHPASLPTDVSVCRWTVVEKSIVWGTLEQAESIWTQISPEVNGVLGKSPLVEEATLHAFRCSVATWLVNYRGGKHEDEAANAACAFLDRVASELARPGQEQEPAITPYISYILADSSHLPSLVAERNGKCPDFLLSALSSIPGQPQGTEDDDELHSIKANIITSQFLAIENNTNNRSTMDSFLSHVIQRMESETGGWSSPVIRMAVENLLAVPMEAMAREQRERVMSLLVDRGPRSKSDIGPSISDINRMTSLMLKLMRRPTFYPDMKFSHLDELATYLAKLARVNGQHGIAVMNSCLPLLQELALLTTRQMTSNIDKREREYLLEAVSQPLTWFRDCHFYDRIVRMVLLKSLISAVEQPSVLKAIPNLDIKSLKQILSGEVLRSVRRFCTKWEGGSGKEWDTRLAPLLVTLATADVLDQASLTEAVSPSLPCLIGASDQLYQAGYDSHWDLKNLLGKLFGKGLEVLSEPDIRRSKLEQKRPMPDLARAGTSVNSGFDKVKILEYVDTVIQDTDEDVKLEYLQTQLAKVDDGRLDKISQLLPAYRVVQRLEGSRTTSGAAGGFDLSVAHSSLCKKLRASSTAVEFILIAQILHAILEKPGCMTQWNVELTLSTVCILSSHATTHPVVSSCPKAYKWLCRLVQVVLRRHRLRLEGHLHLLVTVLQSLLRTLLSHPYDSAGKALCSGPATDAATQHPHWEAHARLFSRLLTLACEPSAASVSRPQPGSLDSATDAARRSAGQHMYLVLMLYVRLQLEQGVPRAVREAVEPGVFSVLDITTPEARRIMNDAMDASGRAVMAGLYKQYLRFGKWSGV